MPLETAPVVEGAVAEGGSAVAEASEPVLWRDRQGLNGPTGPRSWWHGISLPARCLLGWETVSCRCLRGTGFCVRRKTFEFWRTASRGKPAMPAPSGKPALFASWKEMEELLKRGCGVGKQPCYSPLVTHTLWVVRRLMYTFPARCSNGCSGAGGPPTVIIVSSCLQACILLEGRTARPVLGAASEAAKERQAAVTRPAKSGAR